MTERALLRSGETRPAAIWLQCGCNTRTSNRKPPLSCWRNKSGGLTAFGGPLLTTERTLLFDVFSKVPERGRHSKLVIVQAYAGRDVLGRKIDLRPDGCLG